MPVYEYRCRDCDATLEIEQGFKDERPTRCERCGGTLVRVFHPVGLVFKGSGFHKTDYRTTEGESPAVTPSEAKTDSKPSSDSKPSGDSRPSSDSKPSGDSKPAGGGTPPAPPPASEPKKKA